MSGTKYSEFRLQREREEKLKLVQGIGNLAEEIEGLRKRVQTMLRETSEGLRTTFATETQQAQKWSQALKLPNTQWLGTDSALSDLRDAQSQLESLVAEARQVQAMLNLAFNQKADEIGKRLARRLTDLEQQIIGGQMLVRLWWGDEQVQSWDQKLKQARQWLAEEQYKALEKLIADIDRDLQEKLSMATQQEEKHQKRMYLLKALRQACVEMSFQEVDGPRFEMDGNRGGNIILVVDTLNRGHLAFTLSLEKISSFSEIADARCFEEFDKLSQFLRDRFGVDTKFCWPGEKPRPEINGGGEWPLPYDKTMGQSDGK